MTKQNSAILGPQVSIPDFQTHVVRKLVASFSLSRTQPTVFVSFEESAQLNSATFSTAMQLGEPASPKPPLIFR